MTRLPHNLKWGFYKALNVRFLRQIQSWEGEFPHISLQGLMKTLFTAIQKTKGDEILKKLSSLLLHCQLFLNTKVTTLTLAISLYETSTHPCVAFKSKEDGKGCHLSKDNAMGKSALDDCPSPTRNAFESRS